MEPFIHHPATFSSDFIKSLVRDVPDFPKKGIMFKDITPLLGHAKAFGWVCDQLAHPFHEMKIDKVVAIESRGFFFGTGLSERLKTGIVPIRKSGKLPYKTIKTSYALEYGSAEVEMHEDAISHKQRVLLVDDVLATGGTLRAAQALVEKLGGVVVGITCFLEISALKGRQTLHPIPIHSFWEV